VSIDGRNVRRSPRLQVRKEEYGWRRNHTSARDSDNINNDCHGMDMVSYCGDLVTEVGETQFLESSPGLEILIHAINTKASSSDKDNYGQQLQELL